jgi:arabinose-5-phosphate isomerase
MQQMTSHAGKTAEERMNPVGANVVRIEAEALRALAERLAGPMAQAFEDAVERMYACGGRVVVTGMGKSGLVARKIAATLSSTGTPALYLHPTEAVHGDLGMIVRGDVVLALSYSGDTEEILELLPTIKRLGVGLIAMTGDAPSAAKAASNSDGSGAAKAAPLRERQQIPRGLKGARNDNPLMSGSDSSLNLNAPRRSTLAQAADVVLDCSVAQEACSLGLAPTASTTAMLALGDALAVALAEKRGFKEDDFADLHPGGKLGKKLARVLTLMHAGDAVPQVAPETRMPQVIYEMSRKGLGVTTVVAGEKLMGIISDGDLRRLLEKRGKDVMDLTAGECMTRNPKTIGGDEFAAAALNVMEQKKITSLPVVDGEGRLLGILHLHDLWGTQML